MRAAPIGKPGQTLTFAACVVVGCLFLAETVESTTPQAERLVARTNAGEVGTEVDSSTYYAATLSPETGRFGSDAANVQTPRNDLQIADYEAPARGDSEVILASGGEGGFTERRPIPDLTPRTMR